MSEKPWLDNWRAAGQRVEFSDNALKHVYTPDLQIAKLAAAAPAMARALCLVEWRGWAQDESNVCSAPGCRGEENKTSHSVGCELDLALTSAGLDAAARAEVRKMGGAE